MERVHGPDSGPRQNGRRGLHVFAEAKGWAGQFQDVPGGRPPLRVRRAVDLEFQYLRRHQLQLTVFDQPQKGQDGFRFEVDARLGPIVKWALETAGVEVHAHALMLPWRSGLAIGRTEGGSSEFTRTLES